MYWLASHPQVFCPRNEVDDLATNEVEALVAKLYRKLPPLLLPSSVESVSVSEGGSGYNNKKRGSKAPVLPSDDLTTLTHITQKRGYKAPSDVTQLNVLKHFRDYFPNTGLIVGIRHPVLWFQSLYNFRIQNFGSLNTTLPHPDLLIGKCTRGTLNTCTLKGDFAFHLYKLGKTVAHAKHPTDLERQMQERWPRKNGKKQRQPVLSPNKVFLIEISQLSTTNDKDKTERFSTGLKDFVGLQQDMPPMPHKIPGKKFDNATQVIKNQRKIQICNEEYSNTRKHLMELSIQTHHWLMESFLKSPDVVVSDRRDFEEAMKPWLSDPCDALQTQ
jgi:hypothetical protein